MKKALIAVLLCSATAFAAEGDKQRHGVPGGFKPAPESVKSAVMPQLEKLEARVAALKAKPDLAEFIPDAEIYVKAVRFAIDREEFFGGGDGEACTKALANAEKRLAELESGKHSFYNQAGNTLVAYRSYIDGSVQPFFIDVPKGYTGSKPVPLTVWLHGRGDQDTDIHFIRGGGRGPINVPDSIGIAVFGRNCLGFKAAGEVDILEAIASAKKRFNIDPDRVVLGGFSMGGAGSWTVGGHYADQFCGVQPGAGYAETAKYQKIPQAKFPVWYEQKLWGVNDMPGYVRNFFNTMTVGYGGENDGQKQAGELMAETFKSEGREMKLIVGKGAGHGHTQEAIKEINALMAEAAKKGRDWHAKEVTLQTPTLRYNRMKWVEATLLKKHWEDSRIDAKIEDATHIAITTKNIAGFKITKPFENATHNHDLEIKIDGQVLTAQLSDLQSGTQFVLLNNKWQIGGQSKDALAKDALTKVHGLTGPIDDAFMDSFLVVIPSGKCASPAVQKWVDSELAHAQARWQDCFRAVLPTKKDTEITAEDIAKYNLVCFGDENANAIIKQTAAKLPLRSIPVGGLRSDPVGGLRYANSTIGVGEKTFPAATHVPVLIYPNPLNPQKYIVLNSIVTFREDDDRTNSLQNPKLPDWAIIDVTTPPDYKIPGKVVDANFFNEAWRVAK